MLGALAGIRVPVKSLSEVIRILCYDTSSRWGLLTLLAAVITGYLVGSAGTETPRRSPLILEQAQIVSVHPAGLYVRTRAGVQRHFLIDPLDREWASPLAR